MFQSDQECIEFMKEIAAKIEELITFLGEAPERLPRIRVAAAQVMLESIRRALRDYYYENRISGARPEMLPIERTHCFPAIHDAFRAIYVRPNKRPSARWIDELADARFEIQFYLDQI